VDLRDPGTPDDPSKQNGRLSLTEIATTDRIADFGGAALAAGNLRASLSLGFNPGFPSISKILS
jgi:hypothetical protein